MLELFALFITGMVLVVTVPAILFAVLWLYSAIKLNMAAKITLSIATLMVIYTI